MEKKILKGLAVALSLALVGAWTTTAVAAAVLKMTKEELKTKPGDPGVIILDVRIGRDWKASEFKIKGTIREAPGKFESWATKYPKDKTLVLYCA